ncbi:MAG: hypothetical protein ACLT76_18020 [Clostridium fessum]
MGKKSKKGRPKQAAAGNLHLGPTWPEAGNQPAAEFRPFRPPAF